MKATAPPANADIVSQGLLTPDRAEGCNEEYNRLTRAWSTLLQTHLRE